MDGESEAETKRETDLKEEVEEGDRFGKGQEVPGRTLGGGRPSDGPWGTDTRNGTRGITESVQTKGEAHRCVPGTPKRLDDFGEGPPGQGNGRRVTHVESG